MQNMVAPKARKNFDLFFSAEGEKFGIFWTENGLFREVVVEKIDFLYKKHENPRGIGELQSCTDL